MISLPSSLLGHVPLRKGASFFLHSRPQTVLLGLVTTILKLSEPWTKALKPLIKASVKYQNFDSEPVHLIFGFLVIRQLSATSPGYFEACSLAPHITLSYSRVAYLYESSRPFVRSSPT